MNFLTIVVPYLPCTGNASLRFTLDKFLTNCYSQSILVEIHIQISLLPPNLLAPCIDLVKSYQGLFSRQFKSLILSFDCRKDCGIYDAINIAVSNCSSQYVAVCGAGDYFFLNALESSSDMILNHDISIFPVRFLSNNIVYNQPSYFFLPFINICHQGIIFKRSVLISHPYSLRYPILSDYHWNLKYLNLYNVGTSSLPIAVYDDICGLSVSKQSDTAFLSDKFSIIRTKYNLPIAFLSSLWSLSIYMVRHFKK